MLPIQHKHNRVINSEELLAFLNRNPWKFFELFPNREQNMNSLQYTK